MDQSEKWLTSEGCCFPKPGSKTTDGSKVMSFNPRIKGMRTADTLVPSWSHNCGDGVAKGVHVMLRYKSKAKTLVGSSAGQIVHCNLSREGRIK